MGNKLERVTLWRLDRDKWVQKDCCLDGEGSSRYPGRWNKQGEQVVYTAANISLAFLEVYVHFSFKGNSSPSEIEENCYRRIIQIDLDDLEYEEITLNRLPNGWRELSASDNYDEGYTLLQELGSDWFQAKQTPILRVPSAIVPYEFNYLINPTHPDLRGRLSLINPISNSTQLGNVRIKLFPEPFRFDSRYIQLKRSS
jgi:RES domain-containing protein